MQTLEDVLSAADASASLPLSRSVLFSVAAALTLGVIGYVQAKPEFDWIGAVFGLCVFPVAFLSLRRWRFRRAVTRAFRAKPGLIRERTACWDDHGFESWVGQPATRISWDAITRISRTKRSVLLWRSPSLYEFLPTRALDAERMATLDAVLDRVASRSRVVSRHRGWCC